TAPTIHRVNDLHVGMGFTTRKNAEDCLLFRTGMPTRLARDVREVIISPVREHSRKPNEAIARIEQFCPGPRVELFAREAGIGWDAWGDEVGLFDGTQKACQGQTEKSLRCPNASTLVNALNGDKS